MRRKPFVPKYRKHKASGQAVVTLAGRDYYLGPHNSQTSIAEYDRLIAEWLAGGRQIRQGSDGESFTVNELIVAFWAHVEQHYVKNGEPTSERHCMRSALRFVRELYGNSQAGDFAPLALKACRQKMIDADWERNSINTHVGRIRRMFKWGAENEFVPAAIFHALQAVSGLQKGRTDAKESAPITPVPEEYVPAIQPYVSPQVWAMVQLQQLTGMRSGEVTRMRGADLVMTGSVWIYQPQSHKTEHHQREREIFLGPQAQEIIRPFLKRDLSAYLFSPRDAEAKRVANLRKRRKTPRRKRENRLPKTRPKRVRGKRYTTNSYRRAIVRGIEKAGIPRWSPHRLRHSAATTARRNGGLELAQILLGHSKADVTQLYAEQDRGKGIAYAAQYG